MSNHLIDDYISPKPIRSYNAKIRIMTKKTPVPETFLDICMVPIKDLTLLERNPRKITSEQIMNLCKSLQEDPSYFERRPVLVNKVGDTLHVYAGNQRVQAAKKLKMKTVPCIIDEDLPEHLLKQRIIKDNKTYGFFDFDMLANEWDIDILLDSGFTPSELTLHPIEDKANEEPETEQEICIDAKCTTCGQKIKNK